MIPNRAGATPPADPAAACDPVTATAAATPTAVVVFAIDGALTARLREALPGVTIHAADTVSELADLLVAKPCHALGVEVAALGAGAGELLARLAGLFPDLPVIALGSTADTRAVAPLLGSGEVHAFLARPIVAATAREAFEAAFRRNAALARSADLRRAAALRRSSTFLLHESRADDLVAPAVPAALRHPQTPRSIRAMATVAMGATLVLALLGASAWVGVTRTPRAGGSTDTVGAAATTQQRPPAAVASAAANLPAADPAPGAVAAVHAAERALSEGEFDAADAHARAAAAAADSGPMMATRIAAVLDAVAIERRARERAALADARWARAAREWERMRAAEASIPADAPTSRTSEATDVGEQTRERDPAE